MYHHIFIHPKVWFPSIPLCTAEPSQEKSLKTTMRLSLIAQKSLLSDALAKPQCSDFSATKGTGEEIPSRKSLPKSKQGVWSCDKLPSCNKSATFLIVFEQVGCTFSNFFFFYGKLSNVLKNAGGWEVLFTTNAGGWEVLFTTAAGAGRLKTKPSYDPCPTCPL